MWGWDASRPLPDTDTSPAKAVKTEGGKGQLLTQAEPVPSHESPSNAKRVLPGSGSFLELQEPRQAQRGSYKARVHSITK